MTFDLPGASRSRLIAVARPGADGGAVFQHADLEVGHRLLEHRVVHRDGHLGERLPRERDHPDPVGAAALDEGDGLLLGHLHPVRRGEVLREHAAGDVHRDHDRDPFLLHLDLRAAESGARCGDDPGRRSVKARQPSGRRPASSASRTRLTNRRSL